jgi:nucleoside-diphosphate-sugar epimerase
VSAATGERLDAPIRPRELLVHDHRDYHVVDILAHIFMSRVVAATGDQETARRRMRDLRRLGHRTAKVVGVVVRVEPARVGRALFGLEDRDHYFRFKKLAVTDEEAEQMVVALQGQAVQKLRALAGPDGRPRLRVLLTGGTGFIGKEIIWQASQDVDIAEMIVLVRPKEVRDRATGKVTEVLSPGQRGEALLRQLGIEPRVHSRFRFVAGDLERPGLGLSSDDMAYVRHEVTHVIHCAASVAFDDPYDKCFNVNVGGTVNALAFSQLLQDDPASPFVAHLGIETAYIHGRQAHRPARETEIVFPRDFYNNYYELTKAMASREIARHLLEKGLRVVELCPAIVLGDARTGNNRGDTKVVNAPVNMFGLTRETLARHKRGLFRRAGFGVLARVAFAFPCDPTAQLDLVPVDWVAKGILAALKQPHIVGRRVHLATDRPVSAREVQRILEEELQVRVRLADPTFHRNVTLPLVCGLLKLARQERLSRTLRKLGTVFAGYNEWGQPIHEVGTDVSVLGMPAERPVTAHVLRMLCRHNEWVQEFGEVRDPDEISRREKVWSLLIAGLHQETGRAVAQIPPDEFRALVGRRLDTHAFELKRAES